MKILEERCKDKNFSITKFLAKYTMLTQEGLPDIHGFNEKLMVQTDYDKKIRSYAKEQASKPLPQGSPIGKLNLEYFENLFFYKMKLNTSSLSSQTLQSTLILIKVTES